ncbi:MAG: hypothetical protein PF694_01960 [Bacteroidetes bacterium]|jgi:hypothetical protein|nr:hypothetical protein [Bacteroidota bacterium]
MMKILSKWINITAGLTLLFSPACSFFDQQADAISGATGMPQGGNSLFHRTEETALSMGEILVRGEVKNNETLDFSKLYKREVIVKESLFDSTGLNFVGAYRYKGYSLFDMLNTVELAKKNQEAFRPIIDLYVIVRNAAEETAVFSWAEIFLTADPHQILIATESAPIKPYRKEVDYPVADSWKLVSARDLFAFRNIENPTSIEIRSFDQKDFPIIRDMEPLYAENIAVWKQDSLLKTISTIPEDLPIHEYITNFYGMGMGFHPNDGFKGVALSKMLEDIVDVFDPELNRSGLVCFAGADGYRAVYSYSELFNRPDGLSPILDISQQDSSGGRFRLFHPEEFYADRSVKALQTIYFFSE